MVSTFTGDTRPQVVPKHSSCQISVKTLLQINWVRTSIKKVLCYSPAHGKDTDGSIDGAQHPSQGCHSLSFLQCRLASGQALGFLCVILPHLLNKKVTGEVRGFVFIDEKIKAQVAKSSILERVQLIQQQRRDLNHVCPSSSRCPIPLTTELHSWSMLPDLSPEVRLGGNREGEWNEKVIITRRTGELQRRNSKL